MMYEKTSIIYEISIDGIDGTVIYDKTTKEINWELSFEDRFYDKNSMKLEELYNMVAKMLEKIKEFNKGE